MNKEEIDHALECLLAFNGRVHWLDQGYCIRFEIRRVEPGPPRPHGLSYSFTLHDSDGVHMLERIPLDLDQVR
jgi:hypothetical protein